MFGPLGTIASLKNSMLTKPFMIVDNGQCMKPIFLLALSWYSTEVIKA